MAEYIEKQAVIDAVKGRFSMPVDNLIVEVMKVLPPADVRPVVRGRWIDYDDDFGAYCCSKCEENAPEDIQWNFCPNCGADMREAQP